MPAEIRSGKPASVSPSARTRADLTAERLRGVHTGSREHDDELVASDTSGLRSVRQRTHEDVRDLAEQGVAELVARAIVDLLEVVAVDDEQAQSEALLLRVEQRELEPLLEAAPVQDPRQRIRRCAETLALEGERRVE